MSKALECLEKIIDKGRINAGSCCHWRECLSENKCILHNNDLMCDDYIRANIIKQALIKSKENKRVLKLVFEKRVDMWHLADLLEQTYEMYLAFCESEGYANGYILTQEEFDLVKKVSKDETK